MDPTPNDISKREDLILFLLDQGASVPDSNVYIKEVDEGKPDSVTQTPELEGTVLGAAITHASYQMVSRLIAEGAEVHARQRWWDPYDPTRAFHFSMSYSKGVTTLQIASLFWNLEVIRALVDHRGDMTVAEMVSKADDHGRLPLHWALVGDWKDKHGEDPSDEKNKIISQIAPQMISTVKLLRKAKPKTINAQDHQGATMFNFTVRSSLGTANILSIMKFLLEARPLMCTINYHDPVSPTPLWDAMDRYCAEVSGLYVGELMELLNILLANRVNAHLCLHRLCDGSWLDYISPVIIDRLLEGTDINNTNAEGCTAMHYLVKNYDQINAVRHLISQGADVTVTNLKGNTPLHEVMKGGPIRRMGKDGLPDPSQPLDTPIRVREELIKILVDAGGSIDQPNAAGQTPTQLPHERMEMFKKHHGSRGRGRGGRG